MFARRSALLRLRSGRTGVRGEYALSWRANMVTRPVPGALQPDALRSRGCIRRVQRAEWIACPVPVSRQVRWHEVLARSDSLGFWEDQVPPAAAVGRIGVVGERAICADVPRLEVQVLEGSSYFAYSLDACGSYQARAKLSAMFQVLADLDPQGRSHARE